ncbi:MAG: hypothetical protein RLZZ263_1658, partial [Cyanobacteriota bacterium]
MCDVGVTPLSTRSQPADAPPAKRAANVDDVYRQCRELGMRLSRQRRMV